MGGWPNNTAILVNVVKSACESLCGGCGGRGIEEDDDDAADEADEEAEEEVEVLAPLEKMLEAVGGVGLRSFVSGCWMAGTFASSCLVAVESFLSLDGTGSVFTTGDFEPFLTR